MTHITDEQIDELCLSLTGTYTRKERDRAVARAVLALAARQSEPAQPRTIDARNAQFREEIWQVRFDSVVEARRAAQEQLYTERERHTAEVKKLQAEIGRLQSLRLRSESEPMAPGPGIDDLLRCRALVQGTAPAPAVPSIDYMALIDAALVRHKYAQGTRACVAFKHGAEWFREQALTAAPTPPAHEVERQQLRNAQADAVMPLIGPLLDAWEGTDRAVMSEEPELSKQLRAINNAMQSAEATAPTPTAQPAVPEDVARDAERYRWLRDMASQDWLHRNHNYQNLRGAAFDAAIDAARKAGGAA